MASRTFKLISKDVVANCQREIGVAPYGVIVTVAEPTRSKDQNAKMWAMLADVAQAAPDGRILEPEVWKSLFMVAMGRDLRFERDLEGKGFVPLGLRSSQLGVRDMADLITFIQAWGDEKGVVWHCRERGFE